MINRPAAHGNPDSPSWRTLEKAGATYEGTVDVPLDSDLYVRGDLQMRRYRLVIGAKETLPAG
jgi:RimJ/RimL family protein N-acetyltransferase